MYLVNSVHTQTLCRLVVVRIRTLTKIMRTSTINHNLTLSIPIMVDYSLSQRKGLKRRAYRDAIINCEYSRLNIGWGFNVWGKRWLKARHGCACVNGVLLLAMYTSYLRL